LSSFKTKLLDKLYTAKTLETWVKTCREKELKIGFVPTMGALHEGHISLIRKAKTENDLVICSIFVNPTQFNNASDLTNYPRTLEEDVLLLEKVFCDAVFIPGVHDIYPEFPNNTTFININLAPLDQIMEGAFRPGHFDGVVNVVYRLFSLVNPQVAYFGLKDFQQVAVIKHMVSVLHLDVNIVACPTARETSGLAKSSRNKRLSDEQKEQALLIYNTLVFGKKLAENHSPKEVLTQLVDYFNKGNLKLEYIEIVHPLTLHNLEENWVSGAVCCIAAFCGEVRLIDNMEFVS
jgi:pantoate--beta-alanine ligase